MAPASPAPLSYRSQAGDRALAAQAAALLKRKGKPGQEQGKKGRAASPAGAEGTSAGAANPQQGAGSSGGPSDEHPFGRLNRLA
jgi:hypothetical protein